MFVDTGEKQMLHRANSVTQKTPVLIEFINTLLRLGDCGTQLDTNKNILTFLYDYSQRLSVVKLATATKELFN